MSIFRNINIDQLSFWIGFIAASLLWILVGRLLPYIRRARRAVTQKAQTSRQARRLSDEVRLANDTLKIAQGWHLAAPLFSLDEILVLPRLLMPPAPPDREEEIFTTDITDWAIPYLPDWQEISSGLLSRKRVCQVVVYTGRYFQTAIK